MSSIYLFPLFLEYCKRIWVIDIFFYVEKQEFRINVAVRLVLCSFLVIDFES